jgi:hypothetical protein
MSRKEYAQLLTRSFQAADVLSRDRQPCWRQPKRYSRSTETVDGFRPVFVPPNFSRLLPPTLPDAGAAHHLWVRCGSGCVVSQLD